ncbi:hypothetical protein RR48_15397 [Papilio machaon]|uniref:Uncharacterized protein n=1 Tax=Papilio machaon TaxID=76193 RepID=A0A194R084_PAPMA|nr:hypothetical protein RR48_15397 [Papilio machaon]
MISKLKIGVSTSPPPLENNPILQYFEVGNECCNAGPGLVWRVHDAYRKSDGKSDAVTRSRPWPPTAKVSTFSEPTPFQPSPGPVATEDILII